MATPETNNLMLNEVPAATLSTLGFVYDSSNKFDALLSHVFATDYNQTQLFAGKLTSLPYMIQQGSGKADATEIALRDGFYRYLSQYYQDVVVRVEITNLDEGSTQLDFRLILSVTENFKQTQYGYLVRTVRKKLEEVIKLNNYG